jgi:hypothetical protein
LFHPPFFFSPHCTCVICIRRSYHLLAATAESIPVPVRSFTHVTQARDLFPGPRSPSNELPQTSNTYPDRLKPCSQLTAALHLECYLLITTSILEYRSSLAMRVSICTLATALFATTLAAPTSNLESLAETSQKSNNEIVKRDGDGKYFHEPG